MHTIQSTNTLSTLKVKHIHPHCPMKHPSSLDRTDPQDNNSNRRKIWRKISFIHPRDILSCKPFDETYLTVSQDRTKSTGLTKQTLGSTWVIITTYSDDVDQILHSCLDSLKQQNVITTSNVNSFTFLLVLDSRSLTRVLLSGCCTSKIVSPLPEGWMLTARRGTFARSAEQPLVGFDVSSLQRIS